MPQKSLSRIAWDSLQREIHYHQRLRQLQTEMQAVYNERWEFGWDDLTAYLESWLEIIEDTLTLSPKEE